MIGNVYAAIYPATARNFTDLYNSYKVVDIDESAASPRYYGYLRLDGYYFIAKATISGGVTNFTYTKGTSAYSTAWTNRASETYAEFNLVFNTGI